MIFFLLSFLIMPAASAEFTLPTISVGSMPDGVAYDSSRGEVFVANTLSNTISVVSGRTNRVVATVAAGNSPDDPACDTGRGEVFVANSFDNTVSVISDRTDRVVATFPAGNTPEEMA